MKKLQIGLLLLGIIVLAIFLLLKSKVDFPEPPPGAIVFDVKYRGLDGGKDELRYNSYWQFGSGNKKILRLLGR